MTANYYGCEGGHAEFTCLAAYYHNKKFRKYAAWCAPCREKYRFPDAEAQNVSEVLGHGTEGQAAGSDEPAEGVESTTREARCVG